MSTKAKGLEGGLYDERNDTTRIDMFDKVDQHTAVAMMAFCRQLGASHLFAERIRPILAEDRAVVFAAVRDRPWPPWGLGARQVSALCQVYPVGERAFTVSPIYTSPGEAANIGLISAVYREALEHITREKGAEVQYLVAEGAVLADRVLRKFGFAKTEDVAVTETARYFRYAVPASRVLAALGLDKLSTPELLAHRMDDGVYERNALFQLAFQIAAVPGHLWERRWVPEIGPFDGGGWDMDLPGGPSEPSTPGPEVIIPGGEVTNPAVVARTISANVAKKKGK